LLSVNHLLDVLLGFFEILSDFLEVLLHEVLVGEKFLVFHQRSNFILGDVFALLKDGHGVVVVLVVEDHVEAGLLEVLEVEAEAAVGEHGHEVGGHQTHNLDLEAVVLHGGVDQHDQRRRQQSFVFLVLAEVLVILEKGDCHFVDFLAGEVEADQAFLGVDFAVESQHFVRVFSVNHQTLRPLVLFLGKRYGEASGDVDLGAVNTSEESSYDTLLVCGSTQEMVKDVWHDSRVDRAVQGLYVKPEV